MLASDYLKGLSGSAHARLLILASLSCWNCKIGHPTGNLTANQYVSCLSKSLEVVSCRHTHLLPYCAICYLCSDQRSSIGSC